MSDSSYLERRYRRLLACYPQAFRREHELAWANGRGYRWARGLIVGLFGLTSVSLLAAFAQHALTYAPSDLIAGCALWLVGLLTLPLILNPRSDQHYHQRHNRHYRAKPTRQPGQPAGEHVQRAGSVVSRI